MTTTLLLRVEGLGCSFGADARIESVSFSIAPGQRVGLWGPSGAGKSLILRCLLGLAPRRARVSGSLRWRDEPERALARPAALAPLRGAGMTLVPQAATPSLDPVRSVGRQLAQAIARHDSRRSVDELLLLAGLGREVADQLPSQLSGGMGQRAAIAIALACSPSLLLADEPTASLDTVTQAAVLGRLAAACDETDAGLLLVSHDLALLAQLCPRILVLLDGRLVADDTIDGLLRTPDPAIRRLVVACQRVEAAS